MPTSTGGCTSRRGRIPPAALPAIVALISIAVFLPALRNGFVSFDDGKNFASNLDFRGLGWPQLRWMWTTRFFNHYAPVSWMTLGLDYTMWKMEPWGYHLTSILFHAVNAMLVYGLARAILPESAPAAVFAALFFAVHPLRVEPVVWASSRFEVVAGTFYLGSSLAWLRGGKWLSLALFALAVLSKETAATLPLVLLILDIQVLRRPILSPRVWLEKIPFFAIGAAAAAMTGASLTRTLDPSMAPYWRWPARLAIAIHGLAFYLWKTVVPMRLSPVYAVTPDQVDPASCSLRLGAALVLAITVAAVILRRRFPALLAVWSAYIAILLPVSGIFGIGFEIAADRYSYLPSAGWAILAGAAVALGIRRGTGATNLAVPAEASRYFAPAAALLALLALAGLTLRYIPVWQDSDTLWSHAVAVEPSFVAHTYMAQLKLEQGFVLDAIDHGRQAVAMNPDYALAHNNLGAALLQRREWAQAGLEFAAAERLKPDLPTAYNGWGYALMMQGKHDDAIGQFRQALRISPGYASARANLERALAMPK